MSMLQHYIKLAFRNLIKYKSQSIISIIGLAIGFTCLHCQHCGYDTNRLTTPSIRGPTGFIRYALNHICPAVAYRKSRLIR